uniref:Uncharacterized protein n=1 Tax=Echeneis naucrates TaxID=173247 RepID=A0A665TC99_ECHNA
MWRIPLLFTLTSRVCGEFTPTLSDPEIIQAEENQNISLDWTFTRSDPFRISYVYITCRHITDLRVSVLYRLFRGDEVPQFQDKQFSGRVQSDRDVLREGRLRLHVSRLRTEDSGLYECDVITHQGGGSDRCHLTVSGELKSFQTSSDLLSPPQTSSVLLSPPQTSSDLLSPPQSSSVLLRPPQSSSDLLSPPQSSSDLLSPPQTSSDLLRPPQSSSDLLRPPQTSSTLSPSRHVHIKLCCASADFGATFK